MFRLQVATRGFNPHESGPSSIVSYKKDTHQACIDKLNEMIQKDKDTAILWWHIYEVTERLVQSG